VGPYSRLQKDSCRPFLATVVLPPTAICLTIVLVGLTKSKVEGNPTGWLFQLLLVNILLVVNILLAKDADHD
jgi:hypothetical protein